MKWLDECRFLSRIDVFPIENGRYGQGTDEKLPIGLLAIRLLCGKGIFSF